MARYYSGKYSYFIKDFSNDLVTFLQLIWGKELLKGKGEDGLFRTVAADELDISEDAFRKKIKTEREEKGYWNSKLTVNSRQFSFIYVKFLGVKFGRKFCKN